MFDAIERLKSEWTDKFVVIDSSAPELARFAQATGVVKTVNMNGRCLVEFDQYNNSGWYDIAPTCLKIVPKPLPKPAAEPKAKPAAKAAAAKPVAAAAPAAKPAAGKRPSTADILAAARGKGVAPATPAGKPSTADILAAARGKQAPAAEPVAAEPPAAEPAAAAPAPRVAATTSPPAGAAPTTTAEKIAWCRSNDAAG
ncbi:MAG: hypothetical protein FJ284_10470 [Planctomycetes bacterium]|nr:hypothetical protein [Planctomycetota bacterium]